MAVLKYFILMTAMFISVCNFGQPVDTSIYNIKVESSEQTNQFFTHDRFWRGADGASSVDLGNGRVLWLFSDGFICMDSSGARNKSTIIRNSIAIQNGYDPENASIKFYWNNTQEKPQPFFKSTDDSWYWTGHGTMIGDKLMIFLMKVHGVDSGLGFEIFGWSAVLISNPVDEPSSWEMEYLDSPETYGTIAGSAAVLKEDNYLYSFGAVEPSSHEVYLLRWKLEDAYTGNLMNEEWWFDGGWAKRESKDVTPALMFTGGTEYSVHYDSTLHKYIQIQSFGFGPGEIGLRLAENLQGPWTDLYLFYTPEYGDIKQPFMYSAKAHPELKGNGLYITYNVNSFDFGELVENQTIYFPKFISVSIQSNK